MTLYPMTWNPRAEPERTPFFPLPIQFLAANTSGVCSHDVFTQHVAEVVSFSTR